MKRDSWLLLHAKWVSDWMSDLGNFCNNHPSNHYDYKSRMMCVMILVIKILKETLRNGSILMIHFQKKEVKNNDSRRIHKA